MATRRTGDAMSDHRPVFGTPRLGRMRGSETLITATVRQRWPGY
jgi:hypothetical protein